MRCTPATVEEVFHWRTQPNRLFLRDSQGRGGAFEQPLERWRHQYPQHIPSHPSHLYVKNCGWMVIWDGPKHHIKSFVANDKDIGYFVVKAICCVGNSSLGSKYHQKMPCVSKEGGGGNAGVDWRIKSGKLFVFLPASKGGKNPRRGWEVGTNMNLNPDKGHWWKK